MTAIASLLLWLLTGRKTGRHHSGHVRFQTNPGTTDLRYTSCRPRRGWRYKSTREGFIGAHALIRAIRERDLSTDTRPMRWWEQEPLASLGTWNTTETVGVFRWHTVPEPGQVQS